MTRIVSPLAGTITALDDVPDQVFARQMMGAGCALIPDITSDLCVSPIDGTVVTVMHHAYVVKNDDGAVLVHCGIDTVRIGEEWSQILTQAGSDVKVGDPILKLDWELLKGTGCQRITPIVGVECKEFVLADDVVIGGHVESGQFLGLIAW